MSSCSSKNNSQRMWGGTKCRYKSAKSANKEHYRYCTCTCLCVCADLCGWLVQLLRKHLHKSSSFPSEKVLTSSPRQLNPKDKQTPHFPQPHATRSIDLHGSRSDDEDTIDGDVFSRWIPSHNCEAPELSIRKTKRCCSIYSSVTLPF